MGSQPDSVSRRSTRLTRTKLRTQLVLLGLVLWTVAIVSAATPTALLRTGQVKGTDFVHFYTLARLGAENRVDLFADPAAQRAIQLAAVPESARDWYPPAYGPQVAIALAPLGWLTYQHALLAWLAFTTSVYLASVVVLVRRSEALRSYEPLVLIAATANPAFWSLFLHGQVSAIGLGIVSAAYLLLQKGNATLAGACLGLLAYKPSLAAPAVATLLVAREWRPLAAATATAAGQILAAALFVGRDGLREYARLLLDTPRLASLLTAQPAQMHSLRAFWLLIFGDSPIAFALYGLSAAAAVVLAAIVWHRSADPGTRTSALLLATVLAAPHLYVYDLVLLTPAWIWLADRCLTARHLTSRTTWVLYLAFVAPILGSVTDITRVQLSIVCMAAMLLALRQSAAVPSGDTVRHCTS